MKQFDWPSRGEFANRVRDLAAMEAWWDSPTRDALVLLGRRRVGKSWLFRRFADEKPAVILVADRVLPATQMHRFADQLEPLLNVRPDLPDLTTLVRILYRLGKDQKVLVVIDEFPYLLPDKKTDSEAELSAIQAVMEEERDGSMTKLMLCGSLIGQMESLLAEKSPLHGRLQKLDVWPMDFSESRELTNLSDSSVKRITRSAVAGGMARYLAELGQGDIKTLVCDRVLDRRGPLFSDPRDVLEQELRAPATFFSILSELADHPTQIDHLTKTLAMDSGTLAPYLVRLEEMRLVATSLPVGAPAGARTRKYRLTDGFIRFWFRFVFPNQDGLQSGLKPEDLWTADIEPYLADFVSPTYEELCILYTRKVHGSTAPLVGSWWGPALNHLRKDGSRTSEEIDVVAANRRNLRIVGECKWTNSPMAKQVLTDLRDFKIPAIAQEKRLKVSKDGPQILLFSRAGFAPALKAAAEDDPKVALIGLDDLVAGLDT
jgi:AAA+ ATPase superfamily predicted ATPase